MPYFFYIKNLCYPDRLGQALSNWMTFVKPVRSYISGFLAGAYGDVTSLMTHTTAISGSGVREMAVSTQVLLCGSERE